MQTVAQTHHLLIQWGVFLSVCEVAGGAGKRSRETVPISDSVAFIAPSHVAPH